jgi:hypothetical protein
LSLNIHTEEKSYSLLYQILGIVHELTTAHTSQQNGVAERNICVLFNCARTILHESGFPLSFWAEAINYAATTRNLCPVSTRSYQVPDTHFKAHPDVMLKAVAFLFSMKVMIPVG